MPKAKKLKSATSHITKSIQTDITHFFKNPFTRRSPSESHVAKQSDDISNDDAQGQSGTDLANDEDDSMYAPSRSRNRSRFRVLSPSPELEVIVVAFLSWT